MKEIKSAVISMIGQVALISGTALGIGKGTTRRFGILLVETIAEIAGGDRS